MITPFLLVIQLTQEVRSILDGHYHLSLQQFQGDLGGQSVPGLPLAPSVHQHQEDQELQLVPGQGIHKQWFGIIPVLKISLPPPK